MIFSRSNANSDTMNAITKRPNQRPHLLHLLVFIFLGAMQAVSNQTACAQSKPFRIDKVEPPNWWIGMKWNQIQLMVYGEGLTDCKFAFEDDRLQVKNAAIAPNSNYAFLNVDVPANLPPGNYKLRVQNKNQTADLEFPILKRNTDSKRHQGFGPEDVIYLITPDRFANGDQSNDQVNGIRDEFDPKNDSARHGGDLQGIIEHLDYLADLGVTTLWLNPVLENRGTNSYHGYAATDHYRIDPRFGSNELYRKFVEEAHRRGLKVIFDHVANHIGIEHPWIMNLPSDDWLNGTVENHLRQKHYLLAISDPHADEQAQEMLKTFWFVDAMPDLNQKNEFLANQIIQHTIWWIEMSGLDGIREDTYPYADQAFMTRWAKAILDEYPDFNIVGEIWAVHPAYLAQFQTESNLPRNFKTNLPAIMDFPLMETWRKFLSGEGKLRDVHQMYAQDFLYTDLENLVVFLDNHDISRAIFHAKGDVDRLKLAYTVLLTSRGIPQILYGTEIGMMGGESHVQLRADFPGGFPRDQKNAFNASGRTAAENEMFDFFRSLFKLRKQHPALTSGKMIHYAPTWNDDTYKILKIHEDEKILVIANGNANPNSVDLIELHHHLAGIRKLKDLQSDQEFTWKEGAKIEVPAMTAKLYLLIK